ncbi:hypothetical protein SK803_15805 [Lentzea sp. BCCO 10_0856]|uniref:Uncharacterized protein n=1 Tax=Lentzea miocenica TaxID=3095431 RepID=A0ABU4T0S0_9PSEU|nr:hypothetical protein [Lentzea sp. BCCO 10_0856]MDX8031690.1 hypothetical protein [Lentzea sp. BCCO 10_0856]
MTPAYGNDSAEGDSENLGDAHPSLSPIPLRRPRRTRRRRSLPFALRQVVPGRPSTVWPCAQDDLYEGTGLLASWLLTAVVKIVTTYSQPGQRVLLLEPATHLSAFGPRTANDGHGQSRPGPYAGLHEAGWTVVRLGRGIQTQTAVAHPEQVSEHLDAESGTGPRGSISSPTTDRLSAPSSDADSEPDPALSKLSPDSYDLVIAGAEPGVLDWLRPASWSSVLTPTGILAVITQGDRSGNRLVDPASSLVRAADRVGLRYLDRIALLRAPVRDGALGVAASTSHTRSHISTRPFATLVRHVQVHDDLLVFTRKPAADGEVSSDG